MGLQRMGAVLADKTLMKPAQLGSISSYLSSLDDDLSARVDDLFGRYPALHGFSVQGANALPEAVRNNVMANTLVVAEVAAVRRLGDELEQRIAAQGLRHLPGLRLVEPHERRLENEARVHAEAQ